MDIDWSKAPKGTTGAMVSNFDSTKSGGATFVGKIEFVPSSGQRDYYIEGKDKWTYYEAPKAWTGEGLPPVGTVCEFMKHNSPPAPEGQWTVGDIRYVSDCTVVIGGDKCEHIHHPRNCSFRPVRTPEQIAAEEHCKALDIALSDTADVLKQCDPMEKNSAIAAVQGLIMKGYRKPTDQ